MIQGLGVQPRARIPHYNEYAARCIRLRADPQLARALADASHCFDGVDDQIEEHLLQLNAVPLNGRQVVCELELERDTAPEQFAAGQGDDLENGLVDVQPILLRRHFF